MINTIIALLVEFGLLSSAEGEILAQKIRQGTLPYDYPSSAAQVKKWIAEAKKEVPAED